jgi:carbonic anhydrase
VLRLHPAIKKAISERGLSLHGMIYDISAGALTIISEAGSKKPTGLWSPN